MVHRTKDVYPKLVSNLWGLGNEGFNYDKKVGPRLDVTGTQTCIFVQKLLEDRMK